MKGNFCEPMQVENGGCVCRNCHEPIRCGVYRVCPASDSSRLPQGAGVFSAPPSSGPGTELHKLLMALGLRPRKGCGCEDYARQMDVWGVEGCRQRREEILDRLVQEAEKRTFLGWLPFKRQVAARILDMALRRAEAAEQSRVIHPETFITTEDFGRDSQSLARLLPWVPDVVVGIARSGMLPASIMAMHWHVPLVSTSPFETNGLTELGAGLRMDDKVARRVRRVVLVDDTTWNGHEMRRWTPVVRDWWPDAELCRAVVYCHPQAVEDVDLYWALYPGWHFLEWNLWNSGHAEGMATDLDGVLCDEATGQPLHIPRRRPVLAIVTGRSERAREPTIAWLERWGVKYRELLMGPWDDLPSPKEIAAWKAEQYRRLGATLFVESDPDQARMIAANSGKPVLCPALKVVLNLESRP